MHFIVYLVLKFPLKISCIRGKSGHLDTIVGYAPASFLYKFSFTDVLDEDTGKGYQRRFNQQHSLDFRRYIQSSSSTTIPLTFNLRPNRNNFWNIKDSGKSTHLIIYEDKKVLSQVDCQHRLGFLSDLEIELPFIAFIGLTRKSEMSVFNTINAKSKGLSGSLIDFHETSLVDDLDRVKPELSIALKLHEDQSSPWYKQLDLGGARTSGMQRKASLRTIQKSVKRFLRETDILDSENCDTTYQVILAFWQSLTCLLLQQWENPRKHMLNKGVGVYSLMSIAADIYREEKLSSNRDWDLVFKQKLADFVYEIDWSNSGPLKGLGGEAGVREAVGFFRVKRKENTIRQVV
ncbi:MAG: DGQHR domain-containing protein [Pseudomonadales bacterium]|nr:DGQHR domain-containing protein [Pseudomonadales bacterium]